VDQAEIIAVGTRAMWVTMQLAFPVLAASLVVGLLVSVFQAVTQLQEPTLTFIPKILAVVVVVVIAGPWMMNTIVDYTQEIFRGVQEVGSSTSGGP